MPNSAALLEQTHDLCNKVWMGNEIPVEFVSALWQSRDESTIILIEERHPMEHPVGVLILTVIGIAVVWHIVRIFQGKGRD